MPRAIKVPIGGVLAGAYGEGCDAPVGFSTCDAAQVSLDLRQNSPNRFNPHTRILFVLPTRSHAQLSVFDDRGNVVCTLIDGILDADFREVTWDGKDYRGNSVSSGVYFYCLSVGGKTLTKKMVLL